LSDHFFRLAFRENTGSEYQVIAGQSTDQSTDLRIKKLVVVSSVLVKNNEKHGI